MKNISAIFLIIGSFIGAGFATGKEIFVFFGMYGFIGILNLILSMIVIYFIIYNYLKLGTKLNANNFKQVSVYLTKKPIIIDIVLMLCFFIVTSALFAGVSEYDAYLNINSKFRVMGIITLILTIIFSIGGIKSLSKISNIVVPLIILMFVAICLYSIFHKKIEIVNFTFRNDFLISFCNGISYAGYNTILSSQLFFSISKDVKNIKKVTIATTIIFFTLLILGIVAMITSSPLILISHMPLLNIAFSFAPWVGYLYLIIMWFAIITTLLGTVYSIVGYLTNFIKNRIVTIIMVCLVCFAFSFVGFGNIVEFLYPLIGAFGILYYILLVAKNNVKFTVFKRV